MLLKAGTQILYISLEYIPDTITKNNITVIKIGITKNEKAEISMYFNSFHQKYIERGMFINHGVLTRLSQNRQTD